MSLQGYVDVLIIGAGPAGLMCANALAVAGAGVRIIDKRPVNIAAGQADGISPRTIEVLQSYGLAERLIREGNHIHMGTFYNPGPNGGIQCTGRYPIVLESTSRYPFVIGLRQAGIEAIFIDSLKDRGIDIERPKKPSDIAISEDVDELSSPLSYPVKVTVQHLDATDGESKTETIRAKYVVGADGAHSWVRRTLGIEMEGEQTDSTWGVVDAVLETNFPDNRNVASIQSENGSCLLIPREGDKNRLYIQLSDTDIVNPLTGRVDKSRISPDKLLSVARKILYPFDLADPKSVEWWTIYIIGQRVASSYSVADRVFIAGDACHTHSPKAGQGMNASINDIHNLVWKLVHVLRGWSSPSLLKTYEYERRQYAQDLINFDKEFAALYSGKPRTAESENDPPHKELSQLVSSAGSTLPPVNPPFTILLIRALEKHGAFISGVGIQYSPSAIMEPKHQRYAEKLIIGQRMLPQIFVRTADIHPIDIQDMLPADVRFKMLFFVGNLTSGRIAELNMLAEELSKESGILHKYSADGNILSVFEIITIIAGKKDDANYLLVPAFFRPHWSKVLLDDTDVRERQGGHAYERFGIDAKGITLVVIRPDGYVGTIVPSTAIADLDSYFGSFMVSRGGRKGSSAN